MRQKTIVHFESYDIPPIQLEGILNLQVNEHLFLDQFLKPKHAELLKDGRVVVKARFSTLKKIGENDITHVVTYITE